MSLSISPLLKQHWPYVIKIYEEGLNTRIATFETKLATWEYWDENHHKFARLVAKSNNDIIGFAALSAVSKREVYKGVAEVSIYITENSRGMNIGEFLLSQLVIESKKHNIWTLQASIFPQNKASISLHEKCGFRLVGIREKIGQRDGTWYDNLLFEKRNNLYKLK